MSLQASVQLQGDNTLGAGAPSFAFGNDTDTGVYRVSADALGFSTAGTLRASVTNSGLVVAGTVGTDAGSAASPSHFFNADPNTGMYLAGTNLIGISAAGGQSVEIAQTYFRSYGQMQTQNGHAGGPGYAFTTDGDTGMFRSATNQLSFSVGGTEAFRLNADRTIKMYGDKLTRDNDVSFLGVSAGPESNVGANLLMYGGGHATKSHDIELRTASTVRLKYDNSLSRWDYNATDIVGLYDLSSGDNITRVVLSGGDDNVSGSNLVLYGGAHPTAANDIILRANASDVLKYDNSADTWDFKDNDITTTGTVTADGFFSLGDPATIAPVAGVLTITKSNHSVEVEGGAASTDDVTSIASSGISDGAIVVFKAEHTDRTVAFKDGSSLRMAGDFSLDSTDDRICFIRQGGIWIELFRSSNGS